MSDRVAAADASASPDDGVGPGVSESTEARPWETLIREAEASRRQDRFTFWEVFAGVAVFGRGFREGGGKPILLVEHDECAKRVLSHWACGTRLWSEVGELERLEGADVGCCGFPCPGNSTIRVLHGRRRDGLGNPETASLAQLLRLLGEGPRPPVLVLENPPGVLGADGDERGDAGGFLRSLIRVLSNWYPRGEYSTYTSGDNAYSSRRVHIVAWSPPANLETVLLGYGEPGSDATDEGFGIHLEYPNFAPAMGRFPSMVARSGRGPALACLTEDGREVVVELLPGAAAELHGLPVDVFNVGGPRIGERDAWRMLGNSGRASTAAVARRVARLVTGEEHPRRRGVTGTLCAEGHCPSHGYWEGAGAGFRIYGIGGQALRPPGERAGEGRTASVFARDSLRAEIARVWGDEECRRYLEGVTSFDPTVRRGRFPELRRVIKAGWPESEIEGEGGGLATRVVVYHPMESGETRPFPATVRLREEEGGLPNRVEFDDGDVWEHALLFHSGPGTPGGRGFAFTCHLVGRQSMRYERLNQGGAAALGSRGPTRAAHQTGTRVPRGAARVERGVGRPPGGSAVARCPRRNCRCHVDDEGVAREVAEAVGWAETQDPSVHRGTHHGTKSLTCAGCAAKAILRRRGKGALLGQRGIIHVWRSGTFPR